MLVVAAALAACGSSGDDDGGRDAAGDGGNTTFEWTLVTVHEGNVRMPTTCALADGHELEFTVLDDGIGGQVLTLPCEPSLTRLELRAGSYTVRGELFNERGVEVGHSQPRAFTVPTATPVQVEFVTFTPL